MPKNKQNIAVNTENRTTVIFVMFDDNLLGYVSRFELNSCHMISDHVDGTLFAYGASFWYRNTRIHMATNVYAINVPAEEQHEIMNSKKKNQIKYYEDVIAIRLKAMKIKINHYLCSS